MPPFRFANLLYEVYGSTDVEDAKKRVREQPGVASVEAIVVVAMEVELRKYSTKDRNAIRGKSDRHVENKGRLQTPVVVSVVGVVNFVRRGGNATSHSFDTSSEYGSHLAWILAKR
mmetsp:Transcript_19058/g.43593  ORF Transcript_19058/g.43593 Transcript_19058/m.43593 type:complete len:116 (-) Transcript_19058:228-575(-)